MRLTPKTRFGTYVGKKGVTRAGNLSGTANYMNTEKLKEQGFGVIAYYTAKETYGQYQFGTYSGETGGTDNHIPNFMYNQKVVYNTGLNTTTDGNITGWTYEPLKYWPNEPSTDTDGDVDDLDDGGLDGGKATETNNAGRLSFFAYAPWVELSETDLSGAGITAINGSKKLSETNYGNSYKGDPYVTYQIPKNNKGFVDLLWGTQMKGTASENVVEDKTPGVTSTATDLKPWPTDAKKYADEILKSYTMNADLTKQKTSGSVGFLFKHALGILGGSAHSLNPSDDNDYGWGFQVVLDNDLQGAIQGGKKGKETVVLIEYIRVAARSFVKTDGSGKLDEDRTEINYISTDDADFNLATGKWTLEYGKNVAAARGYNPTGDDIDYQYQYIVPKTDATPVGKDLRTSVYDWKGWNNEASSGVDKDKFYLNTKLHEVALDSDGKVFIKEGSDEKTGYVRTTDGSDNSEDHVGVLNTPQNVYDNSADYDPLVFFPGTYPELQVTVKYVVRTKDTNLSKGYTEVTQEITKKITFEEAIQLNKKYNLLMHLGLTSVKFTAQVDDWDDLNDGNRDDDGTGEGTSIRVTDDVYAPQNVGGGSMNDGIDEAITADYNVSALSVAVTGLVDGKEYEIAFEGTGINTDVETAVTYGTASTSITKTTKPYKFTANGLTEVITLSKLPQATADKTFVITVTGPYRDSNNDEQAGGTKKFTITKEKAPLVLTPRATVIPAKVAASYKLIVDITLPDGTSVTDAASNGIISETGTGTGTVDYTTTAGQLSITAISENTTSKNVTHTITAKVGESEGTATVTQLAAPITLLASGTVTAGAASDFTLEVNDANSSHINLADASNTSDINIYDSNDVLQNWTVTKNTTGATLGVPDTASAGTYTVKVKVNDAPLATITVTVVD